jgi:hypothetical protein
VAFLHGHLLLPTGPIKLAIASGAPIIPVFAVRTPEHKIRIHVEPAVIVSDNRTHRDRAGAACWKNTFGRTRSSGCCFIADSARPAITAAAGRDEPCLTKRKMSSTTVVITGAALATSLGLTPRRDLARGPRREMWAMTAPDRAGVAAAAGENWAGRASICRADYRPEESARGALSFLDDRRRAPAMRISRPGLRIRLTGAA